MLDRFGTFDQGLYGGKLAFCELLDPLACRVRAVGAGEELAESWFSKLKERCVWRHEFETLDQAREVIANYIELYHHRPHSRLNYRTPREAAQT